MRVVGHCRSPGVQYAGHADPRAEMLRIGGDGQERLRGCFEQQTIDSRLVPKGDLRDLDREREDDVEVFDRQQVFDARRHPIP